MSGLVPQMGSFQFEPTLDPRPLPCLDRCEGSTDGGLCETSQQGYASRHTFSPDFEFRSPGDSGCAAQE